MMGTTTKALVSCLPLCDCPPPPTGTRLEGWSCWAQGAAKAALQALLTSSNARCMNKPMKTCLPQLDHLCMSQEGFDLTGWLSAQGALITFPELFCRWASKRAARLCCGVRRMMKNWSFWDRSCCPCCQAPNEAALHLLLCSHALAPSNFKQQVDLAERRVGVSSACPSARVCITRSLHSHHPDTLFVAFSTLLCQEAMTKQGVVGWQSFFEGKISKRWRRLQAGCPHEAESTHSAM